MEQVRVPLCHDDVMTWKHIPYYWPFEMGSHRSLVHPRQKRPVMLRFNAFLVVSLNLLFNKRSSFQWFDTHMTSLVGIRARTKWTPSSRWYFQICILLKKISLYWFKFHWNVYLHWVCLTIGQYWFRQWAFCQISGILGACATRNFTYLVRGPWPVADAMIPRFRCTYASSYAFKSYIPMTDRQGIFGGCGIDMPTYQSPQRFTAPAREQCCKMALGPCSRSK